MPLRAGHAGDQGAVSNLRGARVWLLREGVVKAEDLRGPTPHGRVYVAGESDWLK